MAWKICVQVSHGLPENLPVENQKYLAKRAFPDGRAFFYRTQIGVRAKNSTEPGVVGQARSNLRAA